MRIAVAEYFYSLQGEGKTMGIPAVFLRLAGCNLMCGGKGVERDGQLRDGATWVCDTIAVWMHGRSKSFEELISEMDESIAVLKRLREGAHLVITGGEPLLQQQQVLAFLIYLEQHYRLKPTVEIETNATVIPSDELDKRVHYWNTSPKLANSGMSATQRIKPEAMRWFAQNPRTMSKLVIATPEDWEEIKRDFIEPGLVNRSHIVLMPAADSLDLLLQRNRIVAELCIEEGLRMCTRMHIEIWDRLTGV